MIYKYKPFSKKYTGTDAGATLEKTDLLFIGNAIVETNDLLIGITDDIQYPIDQNDTFDTCGVPWNLKHIWLKNAVALSTGYLHIMGVIAIPSEEGG